MEYTRKTYLVVGYATYYRDGSYKGCYRNETKVDCSLRDLPVNEILQRIKEISFIKVEDVVLFRFYDVFEVEIIFEGEKLTLSSSTSGRKYGVRDREANDSGYYFKGGTTYSTEECRKKLGIDPEEKFGSFPVERFVLSPCGELFRFRESDTIIT